MWADEAPSQSMPSSSHMTFDSNTSRQPGFLSTQQHRQRGGAKRRGAASAEGVSVVMCKCEEEAVLRTVQKEGPNKGKQFYTCSKPREQQCQFFEWSDSVPPSSVRNFRGGGRGQGGRGRGGGNSWRMSRATSDSSESMGSKKRAPPTCSVCREVGHTKRSCPQLRS